MPDTPRPHWEPPVPVPVAYLRQFHYFSRMADKVRDLPGAFVECGVGHGTTFAMLAFLARAQKRTLYGFDSFEGFPEPSEADRSWRNPQQEEWRVRQAEVWELLSDTGLLYGPVKDWPILRHGFFRETLREEDPRLIALLHLDCDLHDSYRDALAYLFPRVVAGGIVMFDEYREFSKSHPDEEKWPGATKAILEYLTPLGLRPERDVVAKKWFVVKEA